ncbi:unnamed protein product [Closterium sp. Yama58-4]|nr:unnamed protein product [Closterium sp. Yama58-4]
MRQKAFFGAGVMWSVEEGGLEGAGGEGSGGDSDESDSREGEYDEGSSSEEDKDDNTLGFSRKFHVSASAAAAAAASPHTSGIQSATSATPFNQRAYASSPAHSALSRPSPSRSNFTSSPVHASYANSPAQAAFSSSPAQGAFPSTSIARSASSGTATPAASAAVALRSVMKGSITSPHGRETLLRSSASESGSSRGDGGGDSGEMAIESKNDQTENSGAGSSTTLPSVSPPSPLSVAGSFTSFLHARNNRPATPSDCASEKAFHKQRDIIPLNADDEFEEDDDNIDADLNAAVMDIKGAEDSEEEDDDEDIDEDVEADMQLSGLAAKMEKQAKYLRMKLGGVKEDEEDEEEEEEEEEEGEGALWGQKKREYYSADNVDYEKREYDSADDVDYEKEAYNGSAPKPSVKDASLLTKEEQMAALMSDAPELVGLLSDLKTTLKELNTKVLPLLQQVREGEYATENGVSYLEAKHGLLLHYCCCLLFFLLLRAEGKPVRDHPVVSRLVELRLFLEKIRPIDKKLQYQIEKLLKLASSANRSATPGKQSAAAAEATAGGSLDDLKHRPNPNLLVSKLGGSGGDGGEASRQTHRSRDGRDEEREMREARRRAARSAFVKELAEDVEGRPREMRVEGAMTMMVEGKEMAREVERLREREGASDANSHLHALVPFPLLPMQMRVEGASTMMVEGKEMEREVERLRERAAAEERMFSRVPLNRGEKQRLKALKRSQNMLAGMLDDFDDDIAGIMAAGEEGGAQAGLTGPAGGAAERGGIGGLTSAGMLESLLRPRKLSEAIHEAGKMTSVRGAPGKVISGDADLPLKPDLGERRRAYEAGVVAKQVRKRGPEDLRFDQGDEDGGEREGGEGGEEDEFYAEARKMQEARRSAKAAKYSSSGLIPEAEPSVDEDGRRQITSQIEKNRGLTAHRNKAVKNPRKKYKLKHANAVVRRKGQVRDVKRETAPYGGESTGLIWTEGGSEQLGALLEGGSVYRERFVIRCYEVGVHKTASIETIANLLQEVGTNHAHSVGFSKDGLATTPGMLRHNLIWATTRIHIEMYKYPTWGDVVEIDTWCQLESNILTRRDWIIRLSNSGDVIGRGTSSWVMMNSKTRRLARIPSDVWEEIIVHCPNPSLYALPPDAVDKLPKLKEPADHSKSSLCARRSDLDMNQHVNNVTYIAWMLESLPQDLVDSSELAQISIEYRRECSQNDMVETLASHTVPAAKPEAIKQCTTTDGVLLSKESEEAKGVCLLTLVERESPEELQHFSHILRLQDSKKEINKGHTVWRKRR